MKVAFQLPGTLAAYAEGRGCVEVQTLVGTVGGALAVLFNRHPALRHRVLGEDGHVRPHVNLFVGRESIRHTGGLATPLEEGAEVFILPAVSGGARLNR